MKPLLGAGEFRDAGRGQVGGKAWCLAMIRDRGMTIPLTLCVPCRVYGAYLTQTRLSERIFFEINRTPLDQMRWEEIWDISLRIRHLFLTTPIPESIRADLDAAVRKTCKNMPVAVRSSAPEEDGSNRSFAGLHDSFLNIRGTEEILRHIKLVWASLFSDAALLYRKELGLDIYTSQMAVVIQEMIPSDRSGIFFSVNPSNKAESVLEAVYGLNQALVDGDIEPDRWLLGRESGRIVTHTAPVRERWARNGETGIRFDGLSAAKAGTPPLTHGEIRRIWQAGRSLETLFGRPQDVEWTIRGERLMILQARPITSTGFTETDDKRAWYLTLHRSYDHLKQLYHRIEYHLIPSMIQEADQMGQVVLDALTAPGLCKEINERQTRYDHWVRIYWEEFIPFAHGIRLFGQVYNDAVSPEDPYEFMTLLGNTGLKSMERNSRLEALARMIRHDPSLKSQLADDILPEPGHLFRDQLDEFVSRFGDLSCSTGSGSECQYGETAMIRLLLEFSSRPAKAPKQSSADARVLRQAYFQSFPEARQAFAADILFLGRESYRLRDDDNIHLGRLEARLFEAVQEGRARLGRAGISPLDKKILLQIPALVPAAQDQSGPGRPAAEQGGGNPGVKDPGFRARQITGHPAGPGIASGKVRLVRAPSDLLGFKQGEILVCQGVDPNMTFVVPLAAAVVEERGGMLIHGAIIAREYGLPCITGASNAMQLIKGGDQITVDGYLGIITASTGAL